jgi:uncharacterized protein YndB with AHSA1/START domain
MSQEAILLDASFGHLTRDGDGAAQLYFTRGLAHPAAKVWRALTEDEHLAAWFPFRIEGERRAGAPLRFLQPDDLVEAFVGEMVVFEPESVLEIGWEGETLRFELEPHGDRTTLTLINTIHEIGKAARDAAGWHECLDLLACELDGARPSWESGRRWDEVHPRYVEAFGPEAATIGPPEGARSA